MYSEEMVRLVGACVITFNEDYESSWRFSLVGQRVFVRVKICTSGDK